MARYITIVVSACLLLFQSAVVGAMSINICGIHWPPSTVVEDGKLVGGYSVEVLEEVLKRLDVGFSVTILPWKRCVQWVQSGRYDAIIDSGKDNERLLFGRYPNSFSHLVIVVRGDSALNFYSSSELKGRSVGVVRGYASYLKIIREQGWEAIETNGEEKMLKMLSTDRLDYVLSDTLTTSAIKQKLDLPIKMLTPYVKTLEFYLAFNSDHYLLAKEYDAMFETLLKEGVIDNIYKRHLPFSYTELLAGDR